MLTDSLETPELDTSLDEPDVITSSVASGFLYSVSTLFDNSKLQLAPSIWSHKLWCQTRALLAPVSPATKMSASKLIRYFSSHPVAFGFQAFTPPDNITLNAANRKAAQSLSDIQTGVWCCCTCYSWHGATHLLPPACPCWYSFLTAQGWGRCYTCVWSVWITSGFMVFWTRLFPSKFGNLACILAYLFNSVFRQHHEVWASQFPFLCSLREVIPPSETCLHGYINWSLAQAHSVGLSLSFPPKGGGKARPWTGSSSQCRRDLCQGLCQRLVGHPCLRGLTCRVGMTLVQVARKSVGGSVCTSFAESRRKGAWGLALLMWPEPSASSACSSSTSAAFQVGMLFKFFDQWGSITSNRFVLNMVWCHHLQLRSHHPLFCDFWCFNVKVAAPHHPVIQRGGWWASC